MNIVYKKTFQKKKKIKMPSVLFLHKKMMYEIN